MHIPSPLLPSSHGSCFTSTQCPSRAIAALVIPPVSCRCYFLLAPFIFLASPLFSPPISSPPSFPHFFISSALRNSPIHSSPSPAWPHPCPPRASPPQTPLTCSEPAVLPLPCPSSSGAGPDGVRGRGEGRGGVGRNADRQEGAGWMGSA